MKGWIELEKVYNAISEVEELPGEMPDEMFKSICMDKDAASEALRIIVRQTKDELKVKLQTASEGE
jgi:hypothetical protein